MHSVQPETAVSVSPATPHGIEAFNSIEKARLFYVQQKLQNEMVSLNTQLAFPPDAKADKGMYKNGFNIREVFILFNRELSIRVR